MKPSSLKIDENFPFFINSTFSSSDLIETSSKIFITASLTCKDSSTNPFIMIFSNNLKLLIFSLTRDKID